MNTITDQAPTLIFNLALAEEAQQEKRGVLKAADRAIPFTVLGLGTLTFAGSLVTRTALAFLYGGSAWDVVTSALYDDIIRSTPVGIALGLLISAAMLRGDCVRSERYFEAIATSAKTALGYDQKQVLQNSSQKQIQNN